MSDVITYEYTMQRIKEFVELYQYLQSKKNDIQTFLNATPFMQIPEPVHVVRRGDDEFTSYTYYFKYKDSKTNFLTIYESDVEDDCNDNDDNYVYYGTKDTFDIVVSPLTKEFSIAKDISSPLNELEKYNILSAEELTEAMFNQLQFLYTDEIIYSTFWISYIGSVMNLDCMYESSPSRDASTILKELKEYFNANVQ